MSLKYKPSSEPVHISAKRGRCHARLLAFLFTSYIYQLDLESQLPHKIVTLLFTITNESIKKSTGEGALFLSSPSLSSLELRDAHVYEPSIHALLETASHFCEAGNHARLLARAARFDIFFGTILRARGGEVAHRHGHMKYPT